MPTLTLWALYLTLFITIRFNLNAAFDCYIYNWWLELSWEDRYVLYCKCTLYIFSMLEGLCQYFTFKKVYFFCNKMLNAQLLAGCKASFARKNKAENPGSARLWKRWVTESKHGFHLYLEIFFYNCWCWQKHSIIILIAIKLFLK